ncbi:MAG: APC family permease [Nostocoides sp.]
MSDDQYLRELGYEPQLDRSMGAWSSFSISISCMCVTAGVFTTYAYAMGKVGPIFIWMWLIVAIGQLLVALVLADLSSRMPISGYAYQWASRLKSSHYGWIVGWLGLMAFIPGFTGLNYGLAGVLLPTLGIEPTTAALSITAASATIVQFVINAIGVRVAARINTTVAFVVEIALSIVMTVILLIVGLVGNPRHSISYFTESSPVDAGLITALALSSLLAMWVLTGFEGAADLAEETKLPSKFVPQAVLRSLIFAIVVGFFMLVGLTINNPGGLNDGDPSTILHSALGTFGGTVFESIAMIALFAGGLANMAAASRLMFSMARDHMLPGSNRLRQVSGTTKAPIATIAVVTCASLTLVVIGLFSSDAMSRIVGMAAIGYYGVYGLTILAVILSKPSQETASIGHTGAFSLGRYGHAVRVIAVVWTAVVVAALVIPAENHATAQTAGVFIIIAVLWYLLRLRREINEGRAGVPRAADGQSRHEAVESSSS